MRTLRRVLLLVCAFLMAVAYGVQYIRRSDYVVFEYKPFIYRPFSIWLISAIQLTGVERDYAALIFFGICGMVFILAMLYALSTAWRSK